MHLSAITPVSLIIIGVVALLIFGPKKLPQLGRAMGSTLREFRHATKGLTDDDDDIKEAIVEKIASGEASAAESLAECYKVINLRMSII